MFHSHSILNPTFPTPSTFSSKATELYNPKWTQMKMCSVCVWRFGVTFTYAIESIDSKLISVCLINDYSLIADLHIFFMEAQNAQPFSLQCIKVKLLKLNNFDNWVFFLFLFYYYIKKVKDSSLTNYSYIWTQVYLHIDFRCP